MGIEETGALMGVLRRFDTGVTEGHLHTLLYVGQKLRLIEPRYVFDFHGLMPYSDALDLEIAMSIWNSVIRIRDNRIHAATRERIKVGSASLDKLIALSYDTLKFLAASLRLEEDLQKSRQEVKEGGPPTRHFFV